MYDEVVTGLIQRLAESVASGTDPFLDSTAIAYDLEYERQRAMVLAASAILALAATFGYLITRIALVPTGNALASQKQFVGNVAHELRTPLSIIKTNTEVTLFNENLDGETRETLVSNLEELDRISDIINNLLSMNALLRPEKMKFKNVDMGSIVDRSLSSLSELVDHKNVRIEVRKSEYRSVWGNPSGLDQIVVNVLKNAINFTPAGGTITLVVEPSHNGHIDLTIEDQGVGISEKDLEHIFEPFYRGDRSRSRASGGSGLGLAIVSELVKIHKGAISIKSAPNAGTSVKIKLPCGKDDKGGASSDPGVSEVVVDFSGRNGA